MAVHVGVPNELFWNLTYREVGAVLKQFAESQRAENMRAGLIAATFANVHRKKGSKEVQPGDFFKKASGTPDPGDYMTPKQATRMMDQWAASVNRGFKGAAA